MAIKVTKGLICCGTISKNKYHEDHYIVESFILVSKSAHHMHYAALLEV